MNNHEIKEAKALLDECKFVESYFVDGCFLNVMFLDGEGCRFGDIDDVREAIASFE